MRDTWGAPSGGWPEFDSEGHRVYRTVVVEPTGTKHDDEIIQDALDSLTDHHAPGWGARHGRP